MKTIEVVRLANFHRLVRELHGPDGLEMSNPTIAAAMGISSVYVWQLKTGERTKIDGAAARKIERSMKKPEGWMDTDFDLWPFPDADLLEQVEHLTPTQRIEVQGVLRAAVSQLRQIKPPSPSAQPPKPLNLPRSDIPPAVQKITQKPHRKR